MHRVILTLLLFVGLSCDNVEPFDRNNPSDPGSDVFVPDAPNDLRITIDGQTARLRWSDVSTSEEGYLVERALDDTTNFETVAELGANTTEYTDQVESGNFWAKYRVSSFADRQGMRNEQTIEATVPLRGFHDQQPEVGVLSERRIRIRWDDPYTAEQGFLIERAISPPEEEPSQFEQVATLDVDATEYVDTFSFTSSYVYEYRIRALGRNVQGPYTRTSGVELIVSSPDSLRIAEQAVEGNRITLEWNAGGSAALVEGYVIERAIEGGAWEDVAEVEAPNHSYSTSGLDQSTRYAFRVRSFASLPSSPLPVQYGRALVLQHQWQSDVSWIQRLAFDEQSRIVYMGVGFGSRTRLVAWNYETETEQYSITIGADVSDIEIFPDDERLLVATFSSLDILDARTGNLVRRLIDEPTTVASMSPDGSRVFVKDLGYSVRDVESGEIISRLPDDLRDVFFASFHPSNPILAFAVGNTIHLYDFANDRTKAIIPVSMENSFFSAPGKLRYSATGDVLFCQIGFGGVQLIDPEIGRVLTQVAIYGPPLSYIAPLSASSLGPDLTLLTAWRSDYSDQDRLDLWSFDGKLLARVGTSGGHISLIEAGYSGTHFVSLSGRSVHRPDNLHVWNIETRWHRVYE